MPPNGGFDRRRAIVRQAPDHRDVLSLCGARLNLLGQMSVGDIVFFATTSSPPVSLSQSVDDFRAALRRRSRKDRPSERERR